MRLFSICLSITGLLLLAITAQSQDTRKIPAPDFTNELMLYIDSSNSLIPIPVEKGVKEEEGSVNLNIVYGVLKSPRSSMRLSAANKYIVVFRHASNYLSSPNPKDVYKLIRFNIDQKKGYRSCTIRYTAQGEKANAKGQAAMNTPIDAVFNKVGEDVYTITLSNLTPGEYVFPISEYKMYTFGVD